MNQPESLSSSTEILSCHCGDTNNLFETSEEHVLDKDEPPWCSVHQHHKWCEHTTR